MIRTAVVGVGYLGRFHAQKYKQLTESGQCRFMGVLDFNPARAQEVGMELGVHVFQDFQELVGQVDAVAIASTTQTHFSLAKQALEAGFHINVEKPMTVTAAEAHELLEIAKKKSLVVAVGHSERFNPVYQDLSRRFTHPQFLEFRRHAPFKLRGSDVSVVLDLMIHDLDLACAWLGDSVHELRLVSARGGRMHSVSLDWAEAELLGPQGVNIRLSASRTASSMTRVVRGIQGLTNFQGNFQSMDVEELEWASGDEAPKRKRQETLQKADHLFLETEGFLAAIDAQASGQKSLKTWISGEQGCHALELALEIEGRIQSP